MKTKTLLILFSLISITIFAQNTNPFHYQGILRNAEGELMAKQDFDIRVFIIEEAGSGLIIFSEEQSLTTDEFGQFSATIGQLEELPDLNFDTETYFLKVEIDHDSQGFVDAGGSIIRPTPFASTASQALSLKNLTLDGIQRGQTLKWDGTQLAPANDDGETYSSGDGISITNGQITNTGDTDPNDDINSGDTAGGSLSGTYPNPTLADGSVDAASIAQMGAANGQVLKWNGSSWMASDDDGESYNAGTGIMIANGEITNTGDTDPNDDLKTGDAAGGDLTGAYPNPGLADGSVEAANLAQMGAANGQVLKWNGSGWAASDDDGESYSSGTGISIANGVITNTGDADPDDDINIGDAAAGVLNGTFPNPGLRNGSVSAANLARMGATDGQVLTWSGSSWTPRSSSSYWNPVWRTVNGQRRLNSIRFQPSSIDNIYTEIGAGYMLLKPGFFPSWTIEVIANQMNIVSGNHGLHLVKRGSNGLSLESFNNSELTLGSIERPNESVFTNNLHLRSDNTGPGVNIRTGGNNNINFGLEGTNENVTMAFFANGTRISLYPRNSTEFNLGQSTFSQRIDQIYTKNAVDVSSDRRLKDNIFALDYGLTQVMDLQPVNYTLKYDENSQVHLGFIAQDVQQIIPEIVHVGESNPENTNEIENPLGMTYTELIPVLVKAIQEQQAEIDALKKRIENLENQ